MGLNFGQVGIEFDHIGSVIAMTHVLGLSAKVRKNEHLK